MSEASATQKRGASRWLLFGSLALNLFFIGIAIAMFVRAPDRPRWNRDVFVRTERVAESLPAADAAKLRAQMTAHHDAIADAQKRYREGRDHIRDALRQKPFDPSALRNAMKAERDDRIEFYRLLHEAFATAAEQMSDAGRDALAGWRPGGSNRTEPKK